MNITKELDALERAIKEEAPADTVEFELRITCQGIFTVLRRRSPEQLRRDNVTARNIRGEWIQ